ncbi:MULTISPECIES: hypothetical protein [Bacillaceae]
MNRQRIPEHKLNFTTTAGQAIENMTSNEFAKAAASEKASTKQGNVKQEK